MRTNKKSLFIILLLFICTVILSYCVTNENNTTADARGGTYAGAASCKKCHQAIFDSVLHTAHYNATAPATENIVLGSFKAGENSFVFEEDKKIMMEKRDSGMYQVLYAGGKELLARRFDVVFGLKKGQTYLFWNGINAYQLPLTYYPSVHNWGTSPGYSLLYPDFSRLVGKNCFECHSSYIKSSMQTAGNKEAMDKGTIVYGIDCEKCHGPAAEHVAYQSDNPGIKTARFITTGKQLNYRQRLDGCAVCHSGNDQQKLKSRFLFKLGDTMSDYFKDDNNTNLDVHGNQLGLLSQSKCFSVSGNISCITCHSPHADAGTNMAVYSQQCMACHTESGHNFCTLKNMQASMLKSNCIDCHMRKEPSALINFYLSGNHELNTNLYRNHRIAVYKKAATWKIIIPVSNSSHHLLKKINTAPIKVNTITTFL